MDTILHVILKFNPTDSHPLWTLYYTLYSSLTPLTLTPHGHYCITLTHIFKWQHLMAFFLLHFENFYIIAFCLMFNVTQQFHNSTFLVCKN